MTARAQIMIDKIAQKQKEKEAALKKAEKEKRDVAKVKLTAKREKEEAGGKVQEEGGQQQEDDGEDGNQGQHYHSRGLPGRNNAARHGQSCDA